MRTPRQRRSLLLAGTALAPTAFAQAAWPSQPIHLIVPYPAGGGTDYFARLAAPGTGEVLVRP